MLYLLKVISAWLLPPGIFVLAGIVLSLYLYKKRKGWKSCLSFLFFTVCIYLLSCPLVAGILMAPLENSYKPDFSAAADVIIVLGGGSTSGTAALDNNGNLTGSGANRLLTAMQLARAKQLPVLISGGRVYKDSGNEAEISRNILRNMGFAEQSVIVENQARNTQENAAYTLQLCRERGYKKAFLVTSAFHMPRSMVCFRTAGNSQLQLTPIPCDYLLNVHRSTTVFSFTPSLEAFALNALALHEYLGILRLKF